MFVGILLSEVSLLKKVPLFCIRIDWQYVEMFDSQSFYIIKIWKNAFAPCLGKAKAGLKVTYKKLRIERSMNFMAAHESARE